MLELMWQSVELEEESLPDLGQMLLTCSEVVFAVGYVLGRSAP